MKLFKISAFLLLTCSLSAGDATHLKEIENAKPQYGKALKAKDLKGKVIFFEYWGLN